jgi:hypothetical protein
MSRSSTSFSSPKRASSHWSSNGNDTRRGQVKRWPFLLAIGGLVSAVSFMLGHGVSGPTAGQASASATTAGALPTVRVAGDAGPWGHLEYVPIGIEPPSDCLDAATFAPPRWNFGSLSADVVTNLLRSTSIASAELQPLLQQVAAYAPGQPIVLTPHPDLVLKLDVESRKRIYTTLSRFEPNLQRHPYVLRRDAIDQQLHSSGLKPGTLSLLRGTLYERERFFLFSDLDVLLSRIGDADERLRLVRTVVRKPTWLVSVKVDQNSDVAALAKYWGRGRRSKSLQSLIESAARVPGGASIDIAHLLPPVPRRLIYSFPAITQDPEVANRDCHWTTFNFFNDPAINDYEQVKQFQMNLERTHHLVTDPPTFGDVLLVATPTDGIIHSAIYLADNLVYTKNGYAPLQPWLVMKLDDMLAYYAVCVPPGEALSYRFFRKIDQTTTTQRVEVQ